MAQAQVIGFRQVKDGNPDSEWEDGAGYAEGTGRARCIVVDGASEAYGAIRWANQLVDSFIGKAAHGPATLDPDTVDGWFGSMQGVWARTAPAPSAGAYSLYEERKAETGSFATLLGCEIDGLLGPQPCWTAASLGDTVLFHVRGGRLVEHFPPLRPADFGLNPEGVFTQPAQRDRMRAELRIASRRPLEVGDRLFVATDAFADWMLRTAVHDGGQLWATLGALDHPEVFRRLVAHRRAAGELKNDDVTLIRVEITPGGPESLKVPQ